MVFFNMGILFFKTVTNLNPRGLRLSMLACVTPHKNHFFACMESEKTQEDHPHDETVSVIGGASLLWRHAASSLT